MTYEDYTKLPMTKEDAKEILHMEIDWDWEKFRREAAKDILCALIIHCSLPREDGARISIEYADELIKQLKEK